MPRAWGVGHITPKSGVDNNSHFVPLAGHCHAHVSPVNTCHWSAVWAIRAHYDQVERRKKRGTWCGSSSTGSSPSRGVSYNSRSVSNETTKLGYRSADARLLNCLVFFRRTLDFELYKRFSWPLRLGLSTCSDGASGSASGCSSSGALLGSCAPHVFPCLILIFAGSASSVFVGRSRSAFSARLCI